MRYIAFAAAAALLASAPAAAVNFTGSFAQNFDALGTGGTDIQVLGSGDWQTWRFINQAAGWGGPTWNDTVGINAADLSSGTLIYAPTGSQSLGIFPFSGGTFTRQGGVNAGTSSTDTDRMLGTSPTGGSGNALQLNLVNATGGTLNSLNLGYATTVLAPGAPASQPNELLGYRLYYSLTGNAGTWLAASNLDTVTNKTDPAFTTYNTAGTLALAGGWANGQSLHIRWVDDNDQFISPDQMIAIDDVTLSAAVVPEPATWAMMLGGFGLLGGALRRRKLALA